MSVLIIYFVVGDDYFVIFLRDRIEVYYLKKKKFIDFMVWLIKF